MSIITLLRYPTNTPLGELMLVDRAQRRALGHYQLNYIKQPSRSPVNLYFNYEVDPSRTNPTLAKQFLVEERDARLNELYGFFSAISTIGEGFNDYCLHSVHLPLGDPAVSNRFK